MRDPDLVQRAEQAATTLEQAWMRWRARHRLGSGPLPPVSSYVGYSVEEPWGQPRVVFGVEAAEAERLAAILDRDDYAAANGAESAELRRHHQPDELDPAPARTMPDGQLPAGAQPPQHVLPPPGSLAPLPAQSRPATPATAGTLPATAGTLPATAGTPPAPSESPAQLAARLRDLAARVTAVHPRSGAHDQPQPGPTQPGLADGAGPVSSQPLASDSSSRTQVLPVSTLSRPSAAGDEPASPAWSAGEPHQPAADSSV
jgi:hypothetical protein